ncbi:site-specific integrase [Pseudomonas amygdali]|nr:site-specific integrase [Pseudomonas amygdali]UNO25525.1 site-specific integrase [Pseudomonas amygdali pv. aesculi]WGQ00426.1 site-specific integrase [Pseudomonas amygdali pv. aesculi]
MKDIRPLNKKRNLLYRDNGLDDVTASAIREVLKPDSSYRLWDDGGVQSRNKLMFTLLYELGIRRGELLNIKCEDINFHSNRIYIVRRADEKSDPRVKQPLVKTNDRELVCKAHVIKAVQEYILTYRRKVPGARKHGYLFVTHKAGPTLGQPLSIAGYKDVVNSLRTHIPPLRETLIYSKTQLLPPDKSRPPERCRDEKSNKSAPP